MCLIKGLWAENDGHPMGNVNEYVDKVFFILIASSSATRNRDLFCRVRRNSYNTVLSVNVQTLTLITYRHKRSQGGDHFTVCVILKRIDS